MAHRIVGLDIGSHSVKALGVLSRVRGHEIDFYDEEPLLSELLVDVESLQEPDRDGGRDGDGDGEESDSTDQEALETNAYPTVGALSRSADQAVAALAARGALDADQIIVCYDLFDCLQTELSLPFTRRKTIEEALPLQIEDSYPVDLEEMAIDFEVYEGRGEDGDHRISVVATPVEHLRAFLTSLQRHGVDPRIIDLDPANLIGAYRMLRSAPDTPVALVDIGHEYTDVCIVENEEIILMRRLHPSGKQFTEKLVETLGLGFDEAETYKHTEAFVDLPSTAPAVAEPGQGQGGANEVLGELARELANELGRTFHAHMAIAGRPVESVMLCGGGSGLRGMPQFLSMALGLPVELLSMDEVEAIYPGTGLGAKAVGALGLVARGLGREPASRYNLRQGEFAFKGNYEFLKRPAKAFIIFTLLLITVVGFQLYAKRWAAHQLLDAHTEVLGDLSESVMGNRLEDPSEVMGEIIIVEQVALIPSPTSYEIFRDISERMVNLREDLDLDILIERLSVEIAPRNRITMRGSTDSAESIDEIELELESLPCVGDISRERETRNRTTSLLEFELRAEVVACEVYR